MKTKKTLLFSLLVLIVCFGMFLGTTYAWFTDSVSSAGNIIQTGTLKVGMQWADGKSSLTESTEWKDASVGTIFNNKNWEPGYTEVKHIKISNNGSLALKYQVLIKPEGEVSKLADVIDVYYSDPAKQVASRSDLNELEKLGTLTEVLAKLVETGSGVLEAGKADTITLALKMQEEAGNEYQGLALCEGFAIQVVATQVNAEEDSFGSDYDKDIKLEFASSYADLTSLKGTNADIVLTNDLYANDYLFFGNGIVTNLDLNGKTVEAGNKGQYVLVSQKGGSLTIDGNGVINAGKGFYTNKENAEIIINGGTINVDQTGTLNNIKHHSVAQNDSKIVINGGTHISNVEDAVLFFATTNGVIEVNGGFFMNTTDATPDYFSMGTNKGNTNRVILKGGTFVNWNPLEDRMCYTGSWDGVEYDQFVGPWMIVMKGYKVVSETQANGDVWYSVVPE